MHPGLILFIVLLSFVLQGCSALDRLPAHLPEVIDREATSFNAIRDARFYLHDQPDAARAVWLKAEQRRVDRYRGAPPPYHLLALSGGGGDGAFGAGLLVGWSESGQRPIFDYVTGVSTGALIAPLAFLGPKYDVKLRQLYSSIDDEKVAVKRSFLMLLVSDSLADTAPLAARIEENLTDEMVKEIALEYRKGRMLLIGTTNLDLARPVAWNIGAIADSGHPEAAALIRKILLASAALPGIFPPVMLKTTVNGQTYEELHVDGGVSNQLFLYSSRIPISSIPADVRKRKRVAWIIRNGRFGETSRQTERGALPIASRSIASLIAANASGDTYQAYLTMSRDGTDFNLAFIPDDFTMVSATAFDPTYMKALFERGREFGRSGDKLWLKRPLGFAAE
jgi:predicted acylesterase/phospholipase RssA